MKSRSTIIKKAPTFKGEEKHHFEFFTKVDSTPKGFRKNASDYVKELSKDQSRRFKYTFDNVANHASFQPQYILELFKPSPSSSTLLDIGCGPGIITKPLLPYYKNITGIDCDCHLVPYLRSLEKKKNFTFIPGKFQDVSINHKYNHILCNHSLYYFPREQWEFCINKMLGSLKKDGNILIVLTAPLGPLHDLREPLNPNYPHSGHLHDLLEAMEITYSTDVFVLQHPQPSRQAFKNLIHMYLVDGCYSPDGCSTSSKYINLSDREKEKLHHFAEGFVSGCYDYEQNAYYLHDVCHYIKIEKQ